MSEYEELLAEIDRLRAQHERREELEREAAILRIERNHAREGRDRLVKVLTGIHAVIYPAIVELDDGRRFSFNSTLIHEQMQALSDRIRAIPNEIADEPRYTLTDKGREMLKDSQE